jgi:hypothetical protein
MNSKQLNKTLKSKDTGSLPEVDNANKPNYRKAFIRTLPYSWLLLPFIILLKAVAEYTYNIPKLDDYDAILKFLNNFTQADFITRLQLLFAQHNEHRIVTSRIVYLLEYYLTGDVDFKSIIYIGNLQLIPIFIILIYFITRFVKSMWVIPAFIASLCLFDLAGYDNSGFAMGSMQNYGVVMYFLFSLYFYHTKGKHNIWLAPLLQILCTFSSGNGMIGSMVIAASVMFTNDKRLKIISAITFVVFSGLYFIGYSGSDDPNNKISGIAQIIPFYLVELGAHFGFENAKLAGCIVLVLLAIFFPIGKKFKLNNGAVPLLAILFFALGSLLTSAIFRSSSENMQLAYASRYFIYNNIITAILLCLIFAKVNGKKAQWPVTIALVILILAAYQHNYQYGIDNYKLQESRLLGKEYYYPNDRIEEARANAEKSCQLDIYCIEEHR